MENPTRGYPEKDCKGEQFKESSPNVIFMALGGNHIACCFNDYWKCSSHCVAVCNICLFMLLDIYNMIIVEYIRYYLSILMETMHNNK